MRHSSEPTREMALCLTSEAEQALWCRMANLVGAESSAIRRALETPDRMLENPVHAIMRFWSWDLCADGEHRLSPGSCISCRPFRKKAIGC